MVQGGGGGGGLEYSVEEGGREEEEREGEGGCGVLVVCMCVSRKNHYPGAISHARLRYAETSEKRGLPCTKRNNAGRPVLVVALF